MPKVKSKRSAFPSGEKTAKLKDTLTCPVCYELFNHEERVPKGLPCLHTMCFQCLEKYYEKNLIEHGLSRLPCPVCQLPFTVPKNGAKDVPTNTGLKSIIDVLPSESNFVIFEITGDNNNEDVPIVAKPVCEQHAHAEFIFLCQDCNRGLCTYCITSLRDGPHKNHKLQQFDGTFKDIKKEIEESAKVVRSFSTKLETVQKKRINNANEWKRKSVEELTKQYDDLCAVLDKWYQDAKKDVVDRHTIWIQDIENEAIGLKNQRVKLLQEYNSLAKQCQVYDTNVFDAVKDADAQKTAIQTDIEKDLSKNYQLEFYRQGPDFTKVKSERTIFLVIDDANTLIKNEKIPQVFSSKEKYFEKHIWQINVLNSSDYKGVGIFLKCVDCHKMANTRELRYTTSIIREKQDAYSKVCRSVFNRHDSSWGFNPFLTWDKLRHPANEFVIDNKLYIKIQVHV